MFNIEIQYLSPSRDAFHSINLFVIFITDFSSECIFFVGFVSLAVKSVWLKFQI